MTKTMKEPVRPKRYKSAFFLFLDEFRQINACKGYTTMEMTTRGGSAWRNLTNREKFPFEQKSLKLKGKYVKDVHKYREKLKAMPKSLRQELKARKNPDKPKRALSAYMMFMKEFRKRNSERGWDFQEMTLKGATAWNLLSVAERVPYEQLARKNSEKYHRQLADYKKQQKRNAEKQKEAAKQKKQSDHSTEAKPRRSRRTSSAKNKHRYARGTTQCAARPRKSQKK